MPHYRSGPYPDQKDRQTFHGEVQRSPTTNQCITYAGSERSDRDTRTSATVRVEQYKGSRFDGFAVSRIPRRLLNHMAIDWCALKGRGGVAPPADTDRWSAASNCDPCGDSGIAGDK